MYPTFPITLAADIGDFVWLIFIIIMVVGSVISSIFKAIKETAEKNRRRQMMERDAAQVGGQGPGPRTASQRIQELAEQRRKQLEQMAAERRRQLEELARQRTGGASSPGAPAESRPLPSAESDYDRQMRERQEAARRHQQELEQRREQERAEAQRRQQELQRRRAEAARQRPAARKVAPPPPVPARQETGYRKLEITEEITADMIVREEAPGHEESVHRHVADVATVSRPKSTTPVPRLNHPTRLRQAVMIKEILDRPLALRDGEHDPFSW